LPDWVTHLGTTYIAIRTANRLQSRLLRLVDVRHVLLGALLPDTTRFTVVLVDVLDWPAVPTFTYLIPYHSLLVMGLLSGTIALLFPATNGSSRRAFYLIMTGTAFHFLLDDLEGVVGCGSTTFYPFYFGKPFNGWDNEGNFASALLVISAIAIGVAVGRRREMPPVAIWLTRQRILGAAALLVVALVLPLFFRQWMIQQNAYYLGFVANPMMFEGQEVELCFSEVIATRPATVEEFDVSFVLQTPALFTEGEWVSVRGIYRNGQIKPTILIRHSEFSDVSLSLIAALAFGLLMVDTQQLNSALKLLTKDNQ
jgi:hypothetical protein